MQSLAFLHAKGFVHRDVQCLNLIRMFQFRADGSIESGSGIDLELAAFNDEEMDIQDELIVHIFQPHSHSFCKSICDNN